MYALGNTFQLVIEILIFDVVVAVEIVVVVIYRVGDGPAVVAAVAVGVVGLRPRRPRRRLLRLQLCQARASGRFLVPAVLLLLGGEG